MNTYKKSVRRSCYTWITCFFLLGIVACSETTTQFPEEIEQTESMIPMAAQEALLALGFNPEGAKEVDGYYVVEDVAISKQTVEEGIQACEAARAKSGDVGIADGPDPLKQWATNSTVIGINKVSNMTYEIHSSLNHRTSQIEQAVQIWNNVNGSRLQLSENNSGTPDITIYAHGSSSYSCLNRPGYLGLAMFPENGSPGKAISVSSDIQSNSEFRAVTVHELGHAFGFRHTNWQGNESQSGTTACNIDFDALHIAHTPSGAGNPDPNSIMNRTGISLPISTYDERALEVMYPVSYSKPVITEIKAYTDVLETWYYELDYSMGSNLAQIGEVWVKEGSGPWINLGSSKFYHSNHSEWVNMEFRVRLVNFGNTYFGPYSDSQPTIIYI